MYLKEYSPSFARLDYYVFQTREAAERIQFSGHIVVCLHATASASLIGLANFVMPLRASTLRENEIRPIVFVGNVEYFKKEWSLLANIPKLFMLDVRIIILRSSD